MAATKQDQLKANETLCQHPNAYWVDTHHDGTPMGRIEQYRWCPDCSSDITEENHEA